MSGNVQGVLRGERTMTKLPDVRNRGRHREDDSMTCPRRIPVQAEPLRIDTVGPDTGSDSTSPRRLYPDDSMTASILINGYGRAREKNRP
jgi:hypothetical protein